MIDCAQYRERCSADPRDAAPELAEHLANCRECPAYLERLLRFEGRLERALRVEARQQPERAPSRAACACIAAGSRWPRAWRRRWWWRGRCGSRCPHASSGGRRGRAHGRRAGGLDAYRCAGAGRRISSRCSERAHAAEARRGHGELCAELPVSRPHGAASGGADRVGTGHGHGAGARAGREAHALRRGGLPRRDRPGPRAMAASPCWARGSEVDLAAVREGRGTRRRCDRLGSRQLGKAIRGRAGSAPGELP